MAVNEVRAEEVVPVHDRISWGAIIAGAAVTLACFFILSALGAAIGLSVSSEGVEGRTFGIGAAIYAFIITLVSLFLGGWTTSRFSVGKTSFEAAIHGVVLWGVVFTLLYFLLISGVGMGLAAVSGLASTAPAQEVSRQITADDLRAAGIQLTPEQMRQLEAQAPEKARELAGRAEPAAWWTFAALLISLAVTIGGTLSTSGPSVVLFRRPAPVTGMPPPPPPHHNP